MVGSHLHGAIVTISISIQNYEDCFLLLLSHQRDRARCVNNKPITGKHLAGGAPPYTTLPFFFARPPIAVGVKMTNVVSREASMDWGVGNKTRGTDGQRCVTGWKPATMATCGLQRGKPSYIVN